MQHTLKHAPYERHVHFRRGNMTKAVAPYTARQCWGGVIMPNTAPHILTPEDAVEYRDFIISITGKNFTPFMVGYLTAVTSPEEVKRGYKAGLWSAMKVYPRAAGGHGTTNAEDGINMLELANHPALPIMQEIGMPLLIHPEVNVDKNGVETDEFDREKLCVAVLRNLRRRFKRLKISAEHGTSVELAKFMERYGDPETMVCTVTTQHLMHDRNDLLRGGFQPHLRCYPIMKRRESRDAWRALTTSGAPFVGAGTDSAPHPTHAKERACGCAGGVFTAHAMVPLYTQVFDEMNSLEYLDNFLGVNGLSFLGLEPKLAEIVLTKQPWTMDKMIPVAHGDKVRPYGFHEDPDERFQFQWSIDSISCDQ